ncbi:hypothetical protein WJX73_001512 [Symbiochloris irregularis]|uniref:Uncharacterized protein n=1 Tax=Symbiochloris irregularis TaxID=706552 RepID=A0AAW1PCX5_9CHLO
MSSHEDAPDPGAAQAPPPTQDTEEPSPRAAEASVKVRRPYNLIKQRERWTDNEHALFLEALQKYGRAWRKIEEHVGTKTTVQIRSHAQKFFSKVDRERASGASAGTWPIVIPPPRPKRKSAAHSAGAAAKPTTSGQQQASGSFILHHVLHKRVQQLMVPGVDPAVVSTVAACAATAATSAAAAVMSAAQEMQMLRMQQGVHAPMQPGMAAHAAAKKAAQEAPPPPAQEWRYQRVRTQQGPMGTEAGVSSSSAPDAPGSDDESLAGGSPLKSPNVFRLHPAVSHHVAPMTEGESEEHRGPLMHPHNRSPPQAEGRTTPSNQHQRSLEGPRQQYTPPGQYMDGQPVPRGPPSYPDPYNPGGDPFMPSREEVMGRVTSNSVPNPRRMEHQMGPIQPVALHQALGLPPRNIADSNTMQAPPRKSSVHIPSYNDRPQGFQPYSSSQAAQAAGTSRPPPAFQQAPLPDN